MEIKTIVSPQFQENTYIVEIQGDVIIIDPGCDPEQFKSEIKPVFKKIKYVLLTHGHYDHIISLEELPFKSVYAHDREKHLLENSSVNMSAYTGLNIAVKGINYYSGSIYKMNNIEFYHAPGHTGGCVLIRIEDVLFTGDTLFYDTIGRTDLPTGSPGIMKKSLEIFRQFDGEITCYPGHGDSFKLKDAFETNFFLRREL